ncbi:MAG: DMT family transporter [Sarcina sp.]
MKNNFYKGTGKGVISALTWGIDTAFTVVLLAMTPFIKTEEAIFLAPFVSVFLHDFFSSIWVLIYLTFKGQLKDFIKGAKTRSAKFAMLGGLLGGPVGMTGYYLAMKHMGASNTAAISAIYPAFGAILAALVLKEKVNKKAWLGIILMILGIGLLGFTGEAGSFNLIGFGCAMLTVVGWGSECVVCAYGMKDDEINPEQALQLRQLTSAIFYGIIILPIMKAVPLLKEIVIASDVMWLLVFISIAGTISYLCYYGAINQIGPTKAMSINITYVIWSMIIDGFILGNTITAKMIMCAILIIIGCIMVAAPSKEHVIEENNTQSVRV